MKELPAQYNPKDYEGKIYALWEKSGYFAPEAHQPQADNLSSKKNFCVIMPPPNANGALHIGHALFVTLEDILIRYKRMQGFRTLWLPGADHAGFETQVVYQKKLEREGRSFWSIPREELYKEILNFTLSNKSHMVNQLKQLGASCDWSREKFTLDEDVRAIVYETFKMLYEDGLVYRDSRVVNWCTKHQTTLSDLEVKHTEQHDPLYYIKYGPITLATVRLETKFGDTAIAVNPKDKRYKKFIGKEIEITTLLGPTKIKVIADLSVDQNFGTGAVKVTPAHDPNDFEMWRRHKEEIPGPKSVIDQYGKMDLLRYFPDNEKAKRYHGLKVLEARELMAKDMEKEGLMEKVDNNYTHTVIKCYKCETTLEPRIMPQWFIKMIEPPKKGGRSLRDLAVDAVKQKKVVFVTKKFEKIFMHWMKNLRDWNISRQIVWGIKIPAWFHEPKCVPKEANSKSQIANRMLEMDKCEQTKIAVTEPKCEFCDAKFVQDADVFDTWFSSGQWPFATLLTSHKSSKFEVRSSKSRSDFEEFYPTDVMETGWDILFFWVARMIMLGLYRTHKVPFKTVYLHGLVRDKDRQKMSKSKGNVIDPLGVADLYGADAVRMSLVSGTAPGNDPVISEDKIKGYRNFATKLWNITRFIMANSEKIHDFSKGDPGLGHDRKFLNIAAIYKLQKEVTKDIEYFNLHEAAQKIYQFTWHQFADKDIEKSKELLKNPKIRSEVEKQLQYILVSILKLLHPFMPFVTEAIWQELYKGKKMLMVERW